MSYFQWSHQSDRTEILRNVARHRTEAGLDDAGNIIRSIEHQRLERLPMSAEDFYKYDCGEDLLKRRGWEPILQTILMGTRDEVNHPPISVLRSHEDTIVRHIFSYLNHPWAEHVKLTLPASLVGSYLSRNRSIYPLGIPFNRKSSGFENGLVAYARVGKVTFPKPNNRSVNMMPFKFGYKNSLPTDLQCYFDLIEACPYSQIEKGKVGFLTVHESYVDVGKAQRRDGLHIESPGFFYDDGIIDGNGGYNTEGGHSHATFHAAVEHPWGRGRFLGLDSYEGGIYMASNVSNTSQVWDALVDNRVGGIVDKHGGCEHLRPILGPGKLLKAGELIWMTDCTPHEAIPQEESGYRQFFRVVAPGVSHWYEQHSTRNPKVALPSHVKVVKRNKFEASDAENTKKDATNLPPNDRDCAGSFWTSASTLLWPFFSLTSWLEKETTRASQNDTQIETH